MCRSIRSLDDWQIRTVAYLSIAGAGLLLGVIFAFMSFDQASPDGVYDPTHIEDGVVVPGRIAPAPKQLASP